MAYQNSGIMVTNDKSFQAVKKQLTFPLFPEENSMMEIKYKTHGTIHILNSNLFQIPTCTNHFMSQVQEGHKLNLTFIAV